MNFIIKDLIENPALLKARKAGNGNTVFFELIDKTQEKNLKELLSSPLAEICLKDKNNSQQNALFYAIENEKYTSFEILFNFLKDKKELLIDLINNSNNEKQNFLHSLMRNFNSLPNKNNLLSDFLLFCIENTSEETIQNYESKKHGKLLHYFYYHFQHIGRKHYSSESSDEKNYIMLFESFLKKGANPNEPSLHKANYVNDLIIVNAFYSNQIHVIDLLLNYPIDLNYKNSYQETVLEIIKKDNKTLADKIISVAEKRQLENNLIQLDTKKAKIKL